jgi:hypothetical protein
MALDYRSMLGGLMSSAAGDLGFPIQPRQKNAPPTKELLPSQVAMGDIGDGVTAAHEAIHTNNTPTGPSPTQMTIGSALGQTGQALLNQPVLRPTNPVQQYGKNPVAQQLAMGSMLQQPVKMYARGGDLDPNAINVVGEQGPEAIVNGQVIPLGHEAGQHIAQQPVQPPNYPTYMDLAPVADENGNSPEVPQSAQGVPTGTLNQPVDTQGSQGQTTQAPMNTPEQNGLAQTENSPFSMQLSPNYQNLLKQKAENSADMQQVLQAHSHEHPWKDVGAALIQGGNNFFNRQNNPIQSWNQLRVNQQIQPYAAKDALINAQLATENQSLTAQANAAYRAALAQSALGKNPTLLEVQKEKNDGLTERANIRAQSYMDKANRDADIKAGTATLKTDEHGNWQKVYLKPDSHGNYKATEPWIDPSTRKPFNSPGDESFTLKTSQGPVVVRARQAAGAIAAQDRLTETNRHNTTTEELDRQKQAALQTYRDAGLTLRQQELQFRQTGDTAKADAAARQRTALIASIKSRQQEGKLSTEDANDLIGELNTPLGGVAGGDIQQP